MSAGSIIQLNITGLARGMLAKSVHEAAWNQTAKPVSYQPA